jgi:rhodanese-related sulfurtransferase
MNMNATTTENLEPAEFRPRQETGQRLQLIDVREPAEFSAGRVAGARLIPLGDLERRAQELDRGQRVVLICRSGRRSDQARARLARLGFDNTACLTGGLTAWEADGLPIEKDEHAPWSLERQVRVAAGLLALLGVILGYALHPGFFGLSAFVGAGLVFAGVTDWCGMGLLLSKAPWNRRSNCRRCA